VSEEAGTGNYRDISKVADYDAEDVEPFSSAQAAAHSTLGRTEPAYLSLIASVTPTFNVPLHVPDGRVVNATNTLCAQSLAAMSGAATARHGDYAASTIGTTSNFPPDDSTAFYKCIHEDSIKPARFVNP
jgi:hypothetical protein